MSIVSFTFLAFAVIITAAYFIVPKKWQWIVIFIANIAFYASYGKKRLIYIFFIAFVTWIVALRLEQINAMSKRILAFAPDAEAKKAVKADVLTMKRTLNTIAILLVMGIWVYIKYGNFFIENFNSAMEFVHLSWKLDPIKLLLPLGMSFYTFHSVGYLVDVYREKYPAQKNFFKYFTFMAFFPHMVQGPFSRYDSLGVSILKEHDFSWERLCAGSARILWGVFKKLIVADKIGLAVTEIFANYTGYSGTYILFSVFAYCIQLYADFSGYMDIVCGLSHVLGIELSENFRQPYFARTVDDFWRRWHITLGQWFRDYMFYPVSMGKTGQKIGRIVRAKWGPRMGKLVPGYFALIFVWSCTGLWHGASWTFLIWGYLNLIIIVSTMHLDETYTKIKAKLHINDKNFFWILFCVLRTFILVCFFRFFSTADSVSQAFDMLHGAFTSIDLSVLSHPGSLLIGLSKIEKIAALFGFVLMFLVDLLKENDKWEPVKEKTPFFLRNAAYVVLIGVIILVAGGNNDIIGGFMYANF